MTTDNNSKGSITSAKIGEDTLTSGSAVVAEGQKIDIVAQIDTIGDQLQAVVGGKVEEVLATANQASQNVTVSYTMGDGAVTIKIDTPAG